jgi:hypothetical protein
LYRPEDNDKMSDKEIVYGLAISNRGTGSMTIISKIIF